jgi:hypothetical protein
MIDLQPFTPFRPDHLRAEATLHYCFGSDRINCVTPFPRALLSACQSSHKVAKRFASTYDNSFIDRVPS